MLKDAKDYMIERYIAGGVVLEEEWLQYYEQLMEEAERIDDDHRGE